MVLFAFAAELLDRHSPASLTRPQEETEDDSAAKIGAVLLSSASAGPFEIAAAVNAIVKMSPVAIIFFIGRLQLRGITA